jgi:predicted nucleic acid-binding protein
MRRFDSDGLRALDGRRKMLRPGARATKGGKPAEYRLPESLDVAAAAEAARVRALLEAIGQTIGPYDLLLAGHARSLGLIMVTNNTAEFGRVPGLAIEDWHAPSP